MARLGRTSNPKTDQTGSFLGEVNDDQNDSTMESHGIPSLDMLVLGSQPETLTISDPWNRPWVPGKALTNKPNGHATAPPRMAEAIAE